MGHLVSFLSLSLEYDYDYEDKSGANSARNGEETNDVDGDLSSRNGDLGKKTSFDDNFGNSNDDDIKERKRHNKRRKKKNKNKAPPEKSPTFWQRSKLWPRG